MYTPKTIFFFLEIFYGVRLYNFGQTSLFSRFNNVVEENTARAVGREEEQFVVIIRAHPVEDDIGLELCHGLTFLGGLLLKSYRAMDLKVAHGPVKL